MDEPSEIKSTNENGYVPLKERRRQQVSLLDELDTYEISVIYFARWKIFKDFTENFVQ